MNPSGSQPQRGVPTSHQLLLRVSKAEQKTLGYYAEGINLVSATGRTLIDLQHQACADRIVLAKGFLDTGDRLMRTRPQQYRSAISRYYYSMYHAIRAVAYFHLGGDDKQSHSALPGALPDDFVDSAIWQNELKDARSRRNEADYDPYPIADTDWRPVAQGLQAKAPQLLAHAEAYLRKKGCTNL
ncbi:HEPN domain-containing protein [Kitasatospora sp. NPDC089913]|uniref:HEPN domain-containing protein n=1 Tax=Kitasatospora sp. NPDC089913 TaxID=3364080 RepID=UPI0038146534